MGCSPESIRIFLFVGCALLAVDLAVKFSAIFTIKSKLGDLEFPGLQITFGSCMLLAFKLVTVIVGFYGAYSKNPKCLKVFAIFIAIYSVIFVAVCITDIASMPELNEEITKVMTKYAKDYEWLVPAVKNKETRAWDLVQSGLMCCGLREPSDWTNGKLHQGGDELPRSCCADYLFSSENKDKCTAKSEFHNQFGCLVKINALLLMSVPIIMIDVFLYLILCCLAYILARKSGQAAGALAYRSSPTATFVS